MKKSNKRNSKAAIGRMPLSAGDRERAELSGRRLAAALVAVVRALPEGAQTSGGMARLLNLDRSTSQRVVAASKVRADFLTIYSRMPGIEGLGRFLAAVRERDLDVELQDALDAAIQHCAELVAELTGSLAALVKRIQASAARRADPTRSKKENLDLRRQLFETGQLISGRSVDVQLSIAAMRALPGDPGHLQLARVVGYIGLTGHARGMPLSRSCQFRSGDVDGTKEFRAPLSLTSDEQAVGFQTGAVLERFSTSPFPKVTSRIIGQHLVQLIDFQVQDRESFDVVLGSRVDSLDRQPPGSEQSFFRFAQGIQTPARHFLSDVWQDRSLARASIPSGSVYQTTPSSPPDIQDRWYERFQDCPPLQHLGQGLGKAACEAYSEHRALTEYLFECLGWNAEDFVGLRLETEYPIWCADYQIVLDSGEPADPEPPVA